MTKVTSALNAVLPKDAATARVGMNHGTVLSGTVQDSIPNAHSAGEIIQRGTLPAHLTERDVKGGEGKASTKPLLADDT